ncbi:MAG TPA: amidohydrolase family protein [Microbacterium sp.]|nr:amidohydrolase family protein [Microbacterium sp.]
MYRFTEIAEAGAAVTFGSDVVTEYELSRGAPLYGMQIAATRFDPEYPVDPVRYPGSVRPPLSSRLTADRLLRGYTIDAARQLRREGEMGSLREGKSANLCVLGGDPLSSPAHRLGAIAIEAVMFEGHVVAGSLPTPNHPIQIREIVR